MIELDPGITATKSKVPGAWWTIHATQPVPSPTDFVHTSTFVSVATDDMYRLVNGQHLQHVRIYELGENQEVGINDDGYLWTFVINSGLVQASATDGVVSEQKTLLRHMGMVLSGHVQVALLTKVGALLTVCSSRSIGVM